VITVVSGLFTNDAGRSEGNSPAFVNCVTVSSSITMASVVRASYHHGWPEVPCEGIGRIGGREVAGEQPFVERSEDDGDGRVAAGCGATDPRGARRGGVEQGGDGLVVEASELAGHRLVHGRGRGSAHTGPLWQGRRCGASPALALVEGTDT
jgi:hypothetical protein